MLASDKCYKEVVRMLLSAGAQVNLQDVYVSGDHLG